MTDLPEPDRPDLDLLEDGNRTPAWAAWALWILCVGFCSLVLAVACAR